ncbi:ATP-binding cassette domain-containing protein [Rummeliibacillus pycnus]|uniref:ATP-binding cassette domain-containing protein n=1 Tax=Rummeliibacillus pycnus TaxID=101070 RepID=UPI003D290C6F
MVVAFPLEKVQNKQGIDIRIEKIEKMFGDKTVLKNLSLPIEAGEFVVIVGKSGSGKSTLLRLAAGLEEPTSGTITFNQVPIQKSEAKLRMMYQDSRLLPWKSVLNNVGIGLNGKWKDAAEKTLDHVGLIDYKDQWPSTLSGGQQQRVALARALVNNPSLLLFDEPLSALDALTRLEMQNLIETLWLEKGFTALLVTHDVQEAVRLGDRIILIEDGTITMDVKNNVPRPRGISDPDLTKLEKEILHRIMQS